jgi:hypothetical protein
LYQRSDISKLLFHYNAARGLRVKGFFGMKASITKLEKQIANLRAKLGKELVKSQFECLHTSVVEADYESPSWGPAYPPFRVCKNCGLAEKGWGCGYQVLRGPRVHIVSRDAALVLMRGPLHENNLFVLTVAHRKSGVTKEGLLREVLQEGLSRLYSEGS